MEYLQTAVPYMGSRSGRNKFSVARAASQSFMNKQIRRKQTREHCQIIWRDAKIKITKQLFKYNTIYFVQKRSLCLHRTHH